MAKISYAGCLGLFLAITAQFTFEMCVAAQGREKLTKNLLFEGSRSIKVIDVDVVIGIRCVHYLKGNRSVLDAFMILMGYKNPRSN